MKIFIDCTDLLKWQGNYTGIQTVTINIIKEALLMFGEDCFLIKYDDLQKNIISINPEKLGIKNQYSREDRVFDSVASFPKDTIFLITGGAWNHLGILDYLKHYKKKYNFKVYSIIYDLIPFIVPYNYQEDFQKTYRRYLKNIIKLSDTLLPISKSTKTDLEKNIKHELLLNKKVKIIRLGDKEVAKLVKPTINNHDRFILSVGTFEARKNYQIIYRAYKYAQLMNIDLPKVIIVGQKGALTGDLLEIISNDKSIRNKIILKTNVDNSELNKLYQDCLFTIYPSIYEGWGIPIAESMMYEKFCISSETSSMPEVAGDLIEYFNPYNEKQLFELIKKYTNDETRMKAEQIIRRKYQPTSWKDTLLQILK